MSDRDYYSGIQDERDEQAAQREALERKVAELRAALALAIREADGWYTECRGGTMDDLIDGDPLKAARGLINT